MATVRELQASFVAKADGMKATISELEQKMGSLQKKSEQAAKGMNNKWTSAGKNLQDQGAKITATGDKVQGFGTKWTKVTAVVGAAAIGLGGSLLALTNKVTANAEQIGISADQMGVSTDFYQEMSYWAEENGLSQEQMEKAVGRLNQRMGRAAQGNEKYTKALEALGINMHDVRDGTLSTEDAFAQSISSLSGMSNKQEQAALATELFGTKMARQLLPALQDGSLSIEDAKKKAQELGIVMSEDQIKASEKFQASWREIKSSLGVVGREIALNVMPYFQSFADWTISNMPQIKNTISNAMKTIGNSIKDAVDWFRELSPQAKKLIGISAGMAVALGPVAIGVGKLIKVLGSLVTIVGSASVFIGKFGGFLPMLRAGFAALTGPVGLTVAAIALLTTGVILAYKKFKPFRDLVHKVKDSFIAAYEGVKTFLTTNETLLSMVDSIKSGFQTMKDLVKQAIGAVVSFFKEKISDMKAFWDSEGSSFLEAFSNIFKGIWTVTEPIIKLVVSLIKSSLPVIQTIFKTTFTIILEIVKQVWSNIKGVIDGGLQIIMGLIKTFSGLFTGDFSKMWEGVKDIFSGAIKFIWNFVQLTFFGKLAKGVGSFVKLFSSKISGMWTGIKTVFSTVIKWIVEFVKNRFTSMRNTVNTITTGTKNIINKIWNGILSFFKNIIKGIVDFVKTRFTNLKNNTTNQFNAVRDMAKRVWTGIKNNIVNPVKSGVNWAIKKFTDFKNSVSTTFKNIKDNVFGYVSDMIGKVKAMPGTMKKGIQNGAGKVKEGMLTIGRRMVDGITSGVNGVIAGVEWVMKKFDSDKKLPRMNPATTPGIKGWYARGTKGHPGGDAVMGDGTGSNAGNELVNLPSGKSFLSADEPTLYPDLPKGTEVLPAKITKKIIPQYKDGIFSKIGKAAKSGYNTVKGGMDATKDLGKIGAKKGKDVALDVWDYAKKPGKLLNLALSKLGINAPDASSLIGKIAKGGFNKVKNSGVDYIKDIFKKEEEAGAGPAPSGGASGWKKLIVKAAARMSQSVSSGEINGIIKQIQLESGGNQKTVQSNAVWDVNTAAGNPAQGLLQYIPQTFDAYKVPGHNSIKSGYDQLLAFFNNSNWRSDLPYGKSGWGPTGARKYADGAFGIDQKQLAWIADSGWAESIISHDPAKKARSHKIWQKTGDELGFTGTNKKEGDKEILSQLERIAEAVEQDQDLSVVMDSRVVGNLVEPHVTNRQDRKNYRKRKS